MTYELAWLQANWNQFSFGDALRMRTLQLNADEIPLLESWVNELLEAFTRYPDRWVAISAAGCLATYKNSANNYDPADDILDELNRYRAQEHRN